ncbi:hypothetical protein ACFLT7_05995 [candidate division KSB1 bacterium]
MDQDRLARIEGKLDKLIEEIIPGFMVEISANTRFRRTVRNFLLVALPTIFATLIGLVGWTLSQLGGR